VTQAIRIPAEDAAVLEYLQNSRRGLLVQLAGIGDLVMALPAIQSLRAGLPHIWWTLATRPENADVLQGQVDAIRTLSWPPTFGNGGAVIREMLRLRQMRFDIAIHCYGISSLHGAVGMKALFLGIRPRFSIGRSRSYGLRIFDVTRNDRCGSSSHEVDLNLGLLGSFGVPSVTPTPVLVPHAEAVRRMQVLLQERFTDTARFVVLFPGGTLDTKHWPVVRYAELAARLSARPIGICVVGSGADAEGARRIADAAGVRGCNLAGCLSLPELAALLSLATAYVGNDAGPSHMAAAVGTPCVALFRPCDIDRYRPRGGGMVRIVRSETPCPACAGVNGGRHACMESLSSETVWAAVKEVAQDLLL
jgi:lipopolysaccharide heptosyltransferase III